MYSPTVRCRPQQALRRMNLQIEHRRIGQSIFQRIPIHPAVYGMPDPDVRTDIDVVGCGPVNGKRIVLNVKETVAGRATTDLPARPVEVPDPAAVSHSPKGRIDRLAIRVGPVDGYVCDQTRDANGSGGYIIKPRERPRIARAIGAKHLPACRADEQAVC